MRPSAVLRPLDFFLVFSLPSPPGSRHLTHTQTLHKSTRHNHRDKEAVQPLHMSFAVSSRRARGSILLVVISTMLALAVSVSASSLRHHNRIPTRAFVSAAAALLNKPNPSGWMASKRGGAAGGGGMFGRKGSVKMMGTSCLMTSTPNR